MITKTHTQRTITSGQLESDLSSIRRIVAAAAISPIFRKSLLQNPIQAVQAGFGGESFPLSEFTFDIISAVQADTLAEFIYLINEKIPVL
jgi:hypothetical protein